MSAVLWVGLGGALGSIGRYLLSGWVTQQVTGRFPAGTLTVNVLGCLGIGILAGLAVKEEYFSHAARLFLFTGVAGGFTTFSAFGLETFYLLQRAQWGLAGGYVAASVAGCLLALAAGFAIVPR
ncbi:MAG TPA: fluoride efflux transporter CrcB [Kiritimatiellia bacterium]|jgi:CrcB protein|nr:MAG: putative fluoride ion transporter CrcB [Verrucomicrobia bacterium ADurb.Bin018]HOE00014.1 fluoride efflux transporter CrcB [Kiritimatiellia bacterium]HOE36314.1 fluoride efflux transporter CrcB [Kiritimatiellia bacterium]HOR73926.1 fluoride efflux transporter CrcB [Kiritimatiellia bacterium]HOU58321.1 fluoride efflux transporter CrcB [Kiritimatiellia bacterium]